MGKEFEARTVSGWLMLGVVIGLFVVAMALIYPMALLEGDRGSRFAFGAVLAADITVWLVWGLLLGGFFIVEPNSSKVLLLAGDYRGTVKASGFHWVNPFMSKRGVSLRACTLNGEKLKVNDLSGNPVEIAAVLSAARSPPVPAARSSS